MKTLRAYNVQLWVGLQRGYDGEISTIDDVREVCDEYVSSGDCITITPIEFRYMNGHEDGVVIGWIQYPRFPRTRKQIRERAFNLAHKLQARLGQFGVTVTTPYKSYYFERRHK